MECLSDYIRIEMKLIIINRTIIVQQGYEYVFFNTKR